MLGKIQENGLLCSRIQTFKEIKIDFLTVERNVYHFDCKDSLKLMFGTAPDASHAAYLAHKLATLCISLNEHPSIRYQASSIFARDIAQLLHEAISEFKSANPGFVCNGEDRDATRDRGQLLICDRAFDPITPLMHEYTYQAMGNDLLDINDGVVSYTVETGRGRDEKQAILGEQDDLWVELRHQHIAKVIEVIGERVKDIMDNNAGAALQKKAGADMSITSMAAAVKELPEFRQTAAKLGQHLALAQTCMGSFTGNTGLPLIDICQLEQTMSTGVDEEGKDFKGAKLVQVRHIFFLVLQLYIHTCVYISKVILLFGVLCAVPQTLITLRAAFRRDFTRFQLAKGA